MHGILDMDILYIVNNKNSLKCLDSSFVHEDLRYEGSAKSELKVGNTVVFREKESELHFIIRNLFDNLTKDFKEWFCEILTSTRLKEDMKVWTDG